MFYEGYIISYGLKKLGLLLCVFNGTIFFQSSLFVNLGGGGGLLNKV